MSQITSVRSAIRPHCETKAIDTRNSDGLRSTFHCINLFGWSLKEEEMTPKALVRIALVCVVYAVLAADVAAQNVYGSLVGST